MNEQLYQRILPLKPAILSRAASGTTATDIAGIYTDMTGRVAKLSCGVCVGEMLDYLTGQIHAYEKQMAEKPKPKKKR